MKVVCINNKGFTNLTISKTYEAIVEDDYCYRIISDYGNEYRYPKSYFKSLSEIRNEKIDKLLAE
jgi:hypothetical protein